MDKENRHTSRVFFQIFLFVLSTIVGYSQQTSLTFNHLGEREGLHAEFIVDVIKDSRGYLWLCSNYGLIRYDGKEFKNFRNAFSNPFSISNDNVSHVFEDKRGYLWVSTNQGLNRFDPRTEYFTRFLHNPYDSTSLCGNEAGKIVQDKNGTIWVNTSNGLAQFLGDSIGFKKFVPVDSRLSKTTFQSISIMFDADRELLWVTSNLGLYSFHIPSHRFTLHPAPNRNHLNAGPHVDSRDYFARMYQDQDNSIWITNNYGELYHYFPDAKQWEITSLFPGKKTYCTIYSIFPYDEETFWLCGPGIDGIYILNRRTKKISKLPYDPQLPFSSPVGAFSMYRDNEGIIWLTSNRTISKLDPYLQFFSYTKFSSHYDERGSVSAIEENDNHLYFSMDEVIYSINKINGASLAYPVPKRYFKDGRLSIQKIFYDYQESKLWLGTFNGVLQFDLSNNTFSSLQELYGHKPVIKNNTVNDIFKDVDGNLWIAYYYDALFKFEKKNKKFIDLTPELKSIKNSQNWLKFYGIEEDNNGVIWIATHSGLRLINKSTNKLIHIKDYIDQGDRFASLKIMCLAKHASGNIWLGLLGNGILEFKVNKESATLERAFSTKDGISDNSITGIAFHPSGELWATTFNGLTRINLSTNNIKNYYQDDGLLTDNVRNFPLHIDPKGNSYIGTILGFHTFNPTNFKKKEKSSPVILQKINGSVISRGFDNKIILKYFQNNLTFAFNVLNFSKPENNRYKYRLTGFQKYWISADQRDNTVTYTNINPGDYIFQVQGSNNDGIWNEQGASLKIIILPPPWKTWWAYSLYGIFFIGLLAIGRLEIINRERLKTKSKLKEIEAEKYQELDTMKSRFFANISHEFRTPLTLLLGPIQKRLMAAKESNDKAELGIMQRNASRLLTLVNQLLDLSRLEAGTVRLQCTNSSLNSFVNSIASQFSSMADSKQIDFEITANQNINLYFDADKLEKIITNLLSNAFKFTPTGGSITLTLHQHKPTENFKNGFAEIAVWDTGKGIEPEHLSKVFDRFYQTDTSSTREYEGSGIGLALTKELVDLHKGLIAVTSVTGQGSCFSVKLPLGSAHLKANEIVERTEEARQIIMIPDNHVTGHESSGPTENSSLPKVLILEDNADLRFYLRSNFSETCSIIEASDGEQGLAMALDEIPDLIISDLMMPKMDGLQLCEKVKTNEKTSHIPIILLTAKADIETKLQGLHIGADDYIAKPFDARELQARMHNLIEGRKKLQQKFSQHLSMSASDIKIESIEGRFLKKVKNTIEQYIADTTFSVEILADEVAMSSVQVYRKLKALTGHTPNELIRNIRLERAASLLSQHAGNVSDVAYQVGFNNLSYFAKCFKEKFGVSPSEFLNSPRS
jgi:signal transduction histidine kinase/DNA-binding response OmpR family regulator/ligand-binding sensor domain-containing protein